MAGERTGWQPIDKDTPEDTMLLLTNKDWPVRYDGRPPVKIGYYFKDERRWVIFGASWAPTNWCAIPYPENL